jgi:hypothetical protein
MSAERKGLTMAFSFRDGKYSGLTLTANEGEEFKFSSLPDMHRELGRVVKTTEEKDLKWVWERETKHEH